MTTPQYHLEVIAGFRDWPDLTRPKIGKKDLLVLIVLSSVLFMVTHFGNHGFADMYSTSVIWL